MDTAKVADSSPAMTPSSPSRPDSAETPSLPEEINGVTRELHAHLNRIIIQLLPLALPPCTTSNDVYHSGIQAFAEVFRTFEGRWHDLLQESCNHVTDNGVDSLFEHPPGSEYAVGQEPLDPRIRDVLSRLYIDELTRTGPFDLDLAWLSTLKAANAGETTTDTDVEKEKQLAPRLQAFISHIQASVAKRPQVLVAYAWVFYMALFSGGRWIRSRLMEAGDDFWCPKKSIVGKPCTPPVRFAGFSFLFFPGDEDGEDIKRDFRARLAEVEAWLTPLERQQIVVEAIHIFRHCLAITEELHSQQGPPGGYEAFLAEHRRRYPFTPPAAAAADERKEPNLGLSDPGMASWPSKESAWSDLTPSRPRNPRTLLSSLLVCLFLALVLCTVSLVARRILLFNL